jgi:peptidoglycan/xylan/chitin deacetylase (PgdA/CDA1 family)
MDDSLWHKVERRIARFSARKPISMCNEMGVVSFTFDDVPQSACRRGRAILERYGYHGTYYICGGNTDLMSDKGNMHSRGDLLGLVEGGHELGCHGFGHRNYQTLTIEEIRADISRNRSFFEDLGCDVAAQNFAYPFGCVSPTVKRLIGREFISARGIRNDLNVNRADLALLNAPPLYQNLWNRTSLAELIERNARQKAWLIFFTHEVVDDPGEFGCTPSLLEFAVQETRASGCLVLPVIRALRHVVEAAKFSGLFGESSR